MILPRFDFDPGPLRELHQQALTALGADCDTPWHDRLDVLAEGAAAKIWDPSGGLVVRSMRFPPPAAPGLRNPDEEVFPGCPVSFHLAEAVWAGLSACGRAVVLPDLGGSKPPDLAVLSRLWDRQHAAAAGARLGSVRPAWHFTGVFGLRLELQAISQHWSAARVALSWPGGEQDAETERELFLLPIEPSPPAVDWPVDGAGVLGPALLRAVESDHAAEIAALRQRQQRSLERELRRVNDYFSGYIRELEERASRKRTESTRADYAARVAAARAEHERRIADQVGRHGIRVVPAIDSVLWLAERAWEVEVTVRERRETRSGAHRYVPRLRRWFG
mgnify:CR=1 FL=1